MSPATLEQPPATEHALRAQTQDVARELSDHLAEGWAREGRERFTELRDAALQIAASPIWRDHRLTTDLLILIERLRDAVEADRDRSDPQWEVREQLQRITAVLLNMGRELSQETLDDPAQAAKFVAVTLEPVEASRVAELLGTTPRMVARYRTEPVGQLRRNPDRTALVGQIVHELRGSMTARGISMWFDARVPQLGDRAPLELIDEDPATHREALLSFARGGRGQLDQGGVAHGAVGEGT